VVRRSLGAAVQGASSRPTREDPRGGKRPSPIAGDAIMVLRFARPRPLRRCFPQRRNFLQTMDIAVGAARTIIADGVRAEPQRAATPGVRGDVACARAGWGETGGAGISVFGCLAHASDVAVAHPTLQRDSRFVIDGIDARHAPSGHPNATVRTTASKPGGEEMPPPGSFCA
jgi:hypothetical protein